MFCAAYFHSSANLLLSSGRQKNPRLSSAAAVRRGEASRVSRGSALSVRLDRRRATSPAGGRTQCTACRSGGGGRRRNVTCRQFTRTSFPSLHFTSASQLLAHKLSRYTYASTYRSVWTGERGSCGMRARSVENERRRAEASFALS